MIKCPVCSQYDFKEDFDLCPICHWQHDRVQENDPAFWGGANDLCLNDYRAEWFRLSTPSLERNEARAV